MAKNIKRTKIGEKLRERRMAMHITQDQIADMLDIKRVTYARYETSGNPPISILTKLGQIFGMTTDELLSENISYSEIINDNRNTLIKLSSEHSYNVNNDQSFTPEELDILIKIMDLPQTKRDELVAYISEVVNENLDEAD